MLVLFETPAGYAIFKLLDEKKLEKIDSLYQSFNSPEAANQIVKLKHFEKFADTTEALAATTAAVEGKLSKSLKKLLKKYVSDELQEKLLVADAKLGSAIKEKTNLQCLSNNSVQELMRCIRSQLNNLMSGFPEKEMTAMALGLAHSLSRYKLKFSPDKVDTMIVQAVSLLDDLDKELNNYVMRCREWYGWHFPELGKLITDNITFAKVVKIIGMREQASSSDLSDILPEEVEEKVKEAAEISMGTEISDEDIFHIINLCDQIIDMTNYRTQLYDYLKSRMMTIAPNLTVLVGDLVGARLISHAGSLINLAKHPASTVQILGAEKALFRALKTKKDTPKYGLIYHAQLIGQSSTKNKGKMARMLAAKAALATRVDALGDDEKSFNLGAEHKVKLEARLRILEEGNIRRISGTGKAKAKFEKYQGVSEIKQYPDAADSTLPSTSKRKRSESEGQSATLKLEEEEAVVKQEGSEKKKKKKKPEVKEELPAETVESEGAVDEQTPKKKKKKIKQEVQEVEEVKEEVEEPTPEKKKKKKRAKQEVDVQAAEEATEAQTSEVVEKKKKKKKKNSDNDAN
ncbi:nucleolar protein 58 [Cylas formicarius]|uniref:nucleolar protein 58 n=1 Tax=Cylas formicarius TaxID=197179 RepID=UPI0029588138|nr:nucleolar protein 58 [Cylas formicarius]